MVWGSGPLYSLPSPPPKRRAAGIRYISAGTPAAHRQPVGGYRRHQWRRWQGSTRTATAKGRSPAATATLPPPAHQST